ncbi:hypothetical protein J437_LFUL003248 [Ladona fulva]|uniref:Cytochrome P450 n=1 Tax=Ladona fulva TaxID=123851 RepID=A0A8K0NUA2_LADFU|nr:hypothetical protein J437_LFUL003248 [Ladona fulva]
MATMPIPRRGVGKGVIALLQQHVQSIKCHQSNCSLHSSTCQRMAETVSAEMSGVKAYHEVPGPKPLPVIGNVWRFLPYIGEYYGMGIMDIHRKLHAEYGDIVSLGGIPGRNDLLFVFRPEEAETTLRNEGPWPVRAGMQAMQYYRQVLRKDFYEDGGGLLIENGENWMKARSKANQPMLQPRVSKQYIKPIAAVAQEFVEKMKTLRNDKQEMPDDFINELFKWSLESIAFIALDKRLGCLAPNLPEDSEPQRMIHAVGDFFDNIFALEVGPPIWKVYPTAAWKKFVKALDVFLEVSVKYVDEAIQHSKERKEKGMDDNEPSVLERLLARSDQKSACIMAQDMMFGGIDTTSYSVATALYFIAKNQVKQEILFEELKRNLPDKNDEITEERLENMKYLKACLKESARCSPILAGNLRTAVKDTVLCNYKIPKGTWVLMPHTISRTSEEFFPMSDKYIPERWLKHRPTESTAGSAEDFDIVSKGKRNPFAFLPFGFGPRSCIGRRFAELEMEILLAKIIRNFHIEYNYGEMTYVSMILTTPKDPLRFKVSERTL